MTIKKIPAKHLASGDCVIFPKTGPRTVKKLTSVFDTIISARFDDGKRRTLKSSDTVTIDESKQETLCVRAGDLLRFDLVTRRTSIIPSVLDSLTFPDIKDGFSRLDSSLSSRDSILMSALRDGCDFYTPKAVYWIPKSDLERRNFEFGRDVFKAAHWLVFGEGAALIETQMSLCQKVNVAA